MRGARTRLNPTSLNLARLHADGDAILQPLRLTSAETRDLLAFLHSAMARDFLYCDIDGFSLHAAVRVQARELKRREQLCRTITLQALSDERV